MKNKIDKNIFTSLIESFFAMLVFWVLYSNYNIEFIRSLASDTAFSTLDKYIFADLKHNDKYNTNIQVYRVDELYLREHNFIDDYNLTKYGALFPRSLLASYIDKIDSYKKHPLAVMIDYSMEEGYASYDVNDTIEHISKDDLVLLKVLAKKRDYIILLPKNSEHNFIQKYIDKVDNNISKLIRENIEKQKIIFVNTDLLKSDNKIYRYNPVMKFKDSNKSYYNIALIGWQLIKNKDINRSELSTQFDENYTDKDYILKHGGLIYKSNILYKNDIVINPSYDENSSNWNNLKSYSLNYLLDNNKEKFDGKNIVLIGSGYLKRDYDTNAIDNGTYRVDILANAIKTVLFVDGKLDRVNLFLGFAIVFLIFFTVTFFSRHFLPIISRNLKAKIELALYILVILFLVLIVGINFNIYFALIVAVVGFGIIYAILKYYPDFIWLDYAIEFLLLLGLMLFASYYLLTEYKVWFNWFIPIVIFYLDDLIILWREYTNQNKET